MTTITAQLWDVENPPWVQVTAADLPANSRVTITREAPGLPTTAVRGATDITDPLGAIIAYDVQAPIGRPVIYVATVTLISGDVTEYSAAPIEIPNTTRHVLTDPLTGESVLVDLLGPAQPERRTSARGSVLPIIGRADPIVLHDVRSTETGTLLLSTANTAERDLLTRLLASGRPLVSRHRFDGCDHPAVEILAFNDITHASFANTGRRTWTMPFTTVSDPDPAIAPTGATLQDLHNYQPGTLADLALDFSTLLDIARSDLVR